LDGSVHPGLGLIWGCLNNDSKNSLEQSHVHMPVIRESGASGVPGWS